MLYQIEVVETSSRVISVEADSVEDARDKVTKDYKNEIIVLDDSDFVDYEVNLL